MTFRSLHRKTLAKWESKSSDTVLNPLNHSTVHLQLFFPKSLQEAACPLAAEDRIFETLLKDQSQIMKQRMVPLTLQGSSSVCSDGRLNLFLEFLFIYKFQVSLASTLFGHIRSLTQLIKNIEVESFAKAIWHTMFILSQTKAAGALGETQQEKQLLWIKSLYSAGQQYFVPVQGNNTQLLLSAETSRDDAFPKTRPHFCPANQTLPICHLPATAESWDSIVLPMTQECHCHCSLVPSSKRI